MVKQQLSEIQNKPEKLTAILQEQSSQQDAHQAFETVANQQVTENQDPSVELAAILKEHFSQEELQKALETAAKDAVTEYIQTITPTLSPAQQEKLLHVMEEAGQAQAA
jgi:hypothetical protein